VGALVVARALGRYPARAAVLCAPVLDGGVAARAALRANPAGTLPALFGGRLKLSGRQLFSTEEDVSRIEPAKVRWELVRPGPVPEPVVPLPVLVIGSPDDRVVPRASLDRTAARYGGAPLLFPGMGHDLMLDAGWAEPIEALLDWLDKELAAEEPAA
jgi:pimeloyl-ACP methyl ester carboxylesterase